MSELPLVAQLVPSPFQAPSACLGVPVLQKELLQAFFSSREKTVLAIKITVSHQEVSLLYRCSHGVYDLVLSTTDRCLSRAFLDLDYCCASRFSLRYCLYCDPSPATSLPVLPETTDPPPKRYGPCLPIRSVPTNTRGRGSADDKIVESEVAPRFTSVVAARRSRPCPRAHPLLRIGDPSPYATLSGGSLVDPTVLQALRCFPLSFYKPKHDPEALVAIGTSLAGAQTTTPQTQKSSPKRKKLQKPPISRTFTSIPSAQNIPALRKARFAT